MIYGTKIKSPEFKRTKQELITIANKNYALLNGKGENALDFYLVYEKDLGTQLARNPTEQEQIAVARKKYSPQKPELKAEAIYLLKNSEATTRLSKGGNIRTLIRNNKISGIKEIVIKEQIYLAVAKANFEMKTKTEADFRLYKAGKNDDLRISYFPSNNEIIIRGQRIEFELIDNSIKQQATPTPTPAPKTIEEENPNK